MAVLRTARLAIKKSLASNVAYGAAAILLILCTPQSKAAPITYTYTGHNYSGAAAPYDSSMAVTGTFTFASPFAADLLFPMPQTPTTWSISDGFMTVTESTGSLVFNVGTDSSANITQWRFETGFAIPTGFLFILSDNGSPTVLFPCGAGNTACDGVWGFGAGHAVGLAGVANNPGTWTTVPEPSSLCLSAIGIFGVAYLARNRMRNPA